MTMHSSVINKRTGEGKEGRIMDIVDRKYQTIQQEDNQDREGNTQERGNRK